MKNRKAPVCHSGQVEHKSAVCTCSRGGQLDAALARVPEKVKGGVSFLLSCGKTNSGVLRALAGSPLHEWAYWSESSRSHQDGQRLEAHDVEEEAELMRFVQP